VTELIGLGAPGAEDEGPPQPSNGQIKVPHCELLGNNIVMGEFDVPKFELLTAAGITTIDTGLIRSMEREDDDRADPTFLFELTDGSEMVGSFREVVVPLRTSWKVWTVPTQHLVTFRRPEQEEDEPTTPGAAPTETPGEADPGDPGDPPVGPPTVPPVDPPVNPPRIDLPPPDENDPFG